MIHAWWLIPAATLGAAFGFFIHALCLMAKDEGKDHD